MDNIVKEYTKRVMWKLKDLFANRPPVITRAGALIVRVAHWTPKGDYTERGDKERYRNESDQKKVQQKIDEIFSQKAHKLATVR